MALHVNKNAPSVPRWVSLVVCLGLSVVCVVVYAREGDDGVLHTLQAKTQEILSPFSFAGVVLGSGVESLETTLGDLTADEETLSALIEQNRELRELVAQAEEYRQEAKRLQELLNLIDEYDVSGIAARVIGRSAEAWSQTITIGVGKDDGIDTGMTVMGTSGVIGQVVSTSTTTATVRLLTDPQSGVAVILQSNRAEGIVRGSLEGLLYLEDVDSDSDVVIGDVVITSGLGGSYVSGLIVGTVVSVQEDNGTGTRTIVIAPNDEATSLEEVFVVQLSGSDSSSSEDGEDGE